MLWFWVIVLVVIIGAIAVVAAGRGDSMAEVYDDRPDVALPSGRPLNSDDLRSLRLNTGVRGYRMDEVDALLARLEAEMLTRESEDVRLLERPERVVTEPMVTGPMVTESMVTESADDDATVADESSDSADSADAEAPREGEPAQEGG